MNKNTLQKKLDNSFAGILSSLKAPRGIAVALEFCGYKEPRWVVRNNGEWIKQFLSKQEAIDFAKSYTAPVVDTQDFSKTNKFI